MLVGGCAATIMPPDLGGLYSRAAASGDVDRNPVIVIPGILGSRLVDGESGRVVWGAFGGGYANPQTPDGARLVALPMRSDAALHESRDEVQPSGVLDRVRLDLLGLPIELQAYTNILATLGAGGYRDELLGRSGAVRYGDQHFTCFQFDYDWRRDNVENAGRLHEFIVERRDYLRSIYRNKFNRADADVKFDIVAHSMGGLVARYFLRYGDADLPADGSAPPITWAGATFVERVVLVGTPNAGSIHALDELVNGAQIAGVLPRYDAAIVGTMPSVYQLLPRARHGCVVDASDNKSIIGDLFNPVLWERLNWGLASPQADRWLRELLPAVIEPDARRRIALEHQRKCLERAAQFAAALDAPAEPPAGIELYLFAGDAVPTDAVASVNASTGEIRMIRRQPGDGTVLRSSALMDERLALGWSRKIVSPIRWTGVTFLFEDHLGLTRSPIFADNVLYLLLEGQRSKRAAGL